MSRPRSVVIRAAACASLLVVSGLSGQEPAAPAAADTVAGEREALRVFVDCQADEYCDLDFLRREVTFVNHVRDREAAQVHVLITSQGTGGGGTSFTLDFIGQEGFQGLDDRLRFSVRANMADERVLERLARQVQLGLARYAARTPVGRRLRISYEAAEGEAGPAASPEEDPWNFWVLETGLSAGIEGEERSSSVSFFGDFRANRVTPESKIELDVFGEYSEEDFEVDDSTTVTSLQREYAVLGLYVLSLGPHWSAGAQASAEHSSFSNQDVALRVAPGVEYSLYPYEESERKQLAFLYTVGPVYYDWIEETLFGETAELRGRQSFEVSLNIRQPWGSAGGRFEASSLLTDLERHRLELFSGLELRLFQGLSLSLDAEVARVQDQINLPAGDATEEEILLRIRELQTDFEYELDVGFSYTFGSIFSNVVNPRF